MDLEYHRLKNSTNYSDEYIVFKVRKNTQLENYLIADNSYNEDGEISNHHRHSYRFPEKTAVVGDYIQLWTKPGKDATINNTAEGETNSKIHRFFMGLKKCIWNENADQVLIVKIEDSKIYNLNKKNK